MVDEFDDQEESDADSSSDIFTNDEVWVATLDGVTCEDCGDLDGERFPPGEGPQPQLHFRCRCIRVPALDGDLIGKRPATTVTEDALAGLTGDERVAKVKELTGQVPASTTYREWLADQSDDFQDEVLGPKRAEAFRTEGILGGDLSEPYRSLSGAATAEATFSDKYLPPMTIDELKATAPVEDVGVKGFGKDEAKAVSEQWVADSQIKTIDGLYAEADGYNAELKAVGSEIADSIDGAEWHGADLKERPKPGDTADTNRVLAKIAEGKTPAKISDIVRGTFEVTSPEAADAAIEALAEHYPLVDENWRVTGMGYFDRPVKIRFPNGQIGEVLVAPPELLEAKSKKGGGHIAYKAWRAVKDQGSVQALQLAQDQINIYGKARDSLPPVWAKIMKGMAGEQDMIKQLAEITKNEGRIALRREMFSPGVKAFGSDEARAVSKTWVSASTVKTVEDLYREAPAYNEGLKKAGTEIAKSIEGVEWHGADLKKQPKAGDTAETNRVLAKLASGKTPAQISDIVRGTFEVKSPEAANKAIAALVKRYPSIDENWRIQPTGYFDRPIKILFPNGQIGEVLVAPTELITAKESGGHTAYEAWRKIKDKGSPEALRFAKAQLDIYGAARATLPAAWDAVLTGIAGEQEMLDTVEAVTKNLGQVDIAMLRAREISALKERIAAETNVENKDRLTAILRKYIEVHDALHEIALAKELAQEL